MRESNFDLTSGSFRLDLKTIILLLAFLFQWWDGRARQDVAAAVEAAQNQVVKDTLGKLERMQSLQQYDIGEIKVALAAKGITVKKHTEGN